MRRRLVMAAGAYLACSLSLFIACLWLERGSTGAAGLEQSFHSGSPQRLQDRRVVREINLRIGERARAAGVDSFRIRWEGFWHFPGAAVIDLAARSDGAVRVSLDDRIVLRANPGTEARARRRVDVDPGLRRFVVDYEARDGDGVLDLEWAPASQPLRPLPVDRLFAPTGVDYARRVISLRRMARAFWLGVPLAAALVLGLWLGARAFVRLAVPPGWSSGDLLSPRVAAALVSLVVLAAAVVRLWGIDFGLPHTRSRPDEEALIGMAIRFVQGLPDPGFFIYGPLYAYGLTGVYLVYYVWGLLTGVFGLPVDVAASWHRHWEPFFLLSRLQSAALGTATVLVVYRLALRVFDRETAVLSAALIGFAYLHVRESHFGTVDVTLALVVLISIHFLFRARMRPGGRDDVCAGAFAGLAMATKYNASLLVVPFAMDLALRAFEGRRGNVAAVVGRHVARVAVPAVVVFLVAAPYTILGFDRFVDTVRLVQNGLRTGGGFTDLGDGWTYHVAWTLRYGLGLPLLAAAIVGLAVSVRRDCPGTVILCGLPVAWYIVMGSYRWVFVRYMVPVVPFLCVLAAAGIVWAARRATMAGPRRAVAMAALTLAVLWPSASKVFQFDRLLARRDSRVVAAEWVHAHVPAGSTILQNGGRYGRVQLDAAYRYEEWDERAAVARRERDGGDAGQTDWIVLHESPLGRHVDPWIVSLLGERYELVEFVKGSGSPTPANAFDLQDAFYVPFAGFEDVARPGPDIRIYRHRLRPQPGSQATSQ